MTSSTLGQHTRTGKLLTPPLARIPQATAVSWVNERLPEMLWAVLLTHGLGRRAAISLYRRLARFLFDSQTLVDNDQPFDLTLTGIARLPSTMSDPIIEILTENDASRNALASLLLFEGRLPGVGRWLHALGGESRGDWKFLASAVLEVLDHQSEPSTDCRWIRLMGQIAVGRLIYPEDQRDLLRGILEYPDFGELKLIRPSVRAAEMTLSLRPDLLPKPDEGEWAASFWAACLHQTECFPLVPESAGVRPGVSRQGVERAWSLVVDMCASTRVTSGVDARHDACFGFAFYALSILRDLLGIGVSTSVLGQAGVRMLLELYVTFRFLAGKDDEELWKKYRRYGSGQAKLALLKAEQSDDAREFVRQEVLEVLSNEDMWQEFLDIDLGQWLGSDLRKMSISIGAKEEYDKYYGWTSAFVHGNWAAVRSAVFDTCGNPLHRLHRIPRNSYVACDDVIPDAADLVEKILSVLTDLYSPRENIQLSESG